MKRGRPPTKRPTPAHTNTESIIDGGPAGRSCDVEPAVVILADVLARLAAAREEFEPSARDRILEDLEYDLASELEELRRAA
jgi:hypothetical protein